MIWLRKRGSPSPKDSAVLRVTSRHLKAGSSRLPGVVCPTIVGRRDAAGPALLPTMCSRRRQVQRIHPNWRWPGCQLRLLSRGWPRCCPLNRLKSWCSGSWAALGWTKWPEFSANGRAPFEPSSTEHSVGSRPSSKTHFPSRCNARMTWDDLYLDMVRHPIDDHTAQRLFAGALDPEDAPPGYAPVAALMQAAAGPATADEVVRSGDDVSAVAAVVHAGTETKTREGTRHVPFRRLGSKAIAIAIPALALTATGAAAATGSLPTPAQSAVHGALGHVGVSVPSGGQPSSGSNPGTIDTHTPNNTSAVGPNASGPAKFGLCQAYAASGGHPNSNSVAFKNLQKAAGTAGIAAFCAGVTPGSGSSDTPTGSSGAAGDREGTGSATGTPTAPPGNQSQVSNGSPSADSASETPATPAGPPASTPGSEHASTSIPAGPPASTPDSDHAPTPTSAGPPASTPGSHDTPSSTPNPAAGRP